MSLPSSAGATRRHAVAVSTRAAASATGRPPGKVRQVPASTPCVRRSGAGPTGRAPVRSAAAPRPKARRGPPRDARPRAGCRPRRDPAPRPRSPSADPPAGVENLGLGAGRPAGACRMGDRARAYGRRPSCGPRRPLRRRRKTIPPSSSASRPSTTLVAVGREGHVDPSQRPRARETRLLGRCARGTVVDIVRAEHDARLAYAYASSSVSRPPGSTPTPPAARAAARPCAAASAPRTSSRGAAHRASRPHHARARA